jgi:hypothetical protein
MTKSNRKQFLKSAVKTVGVVAGISVAQIVPQLGANENESRTQTHNQILHVQMGTSGQVLWNVADNVNIWTYASSWDKTMEQAPKDYFSNRLPFVKYVQLMTAAGGSEERDLFKEPLNREITDDYDFEPLIRACRNVLRQGLIPHLKLGNVPLEYSKNYKINKAFGVNILLPEC